MPSLYHGQLWRCAVAQADVVYHERFASGHSQANLLTRLCGPHTCLELIVTPEYLVVTSRLPHSLFSGFYDLEHVIPLAAISAVERRPRARAKDLLLAYRDRQGRSHRVALTPQNLSGFLKAIGQPIG